MTRERPPSPAPPAARNINVFSSAPCDQGCRHCFYVEAPGRSTRPCDPAEEVALVRRIRANYPHASLFLYPKEITTSSYLLPLMAEIGQTFTLSNGNRLDEEQITRLAACGVTDIQITLFGNYEEQRFFTRNTEQEYARIKEHIRLCVKRGLRVTVGNVLARNTMGSIEDLCAECVRLGAQQIKFIRLRPLGNARDVDPGLLLTQTDLEDTILPAVERMKRIYGRRLHLSFAMAFGPNFHGKTLEEARAKVRARLANFGPTDYLCPAIESNHWTISTRTGAVYWCFCVVSDPQMRIGTLDFTTGRVRIDHPIDLSAETLSKRLRGMCKADRCPYHPVCLGGCRATAHAFSPLEDEEERLYDGMDICVTQAYARYEAKRATAGAVQTPRAQAPPPG